MAAATPAANAPTAPSAAASSNVAYTATSPSSMAHASHPHQPPHNQHHGHPSHHTAATPAQPTATGTSYPAANGGSSSTTAGGGAGYPSAIPPSHAADNMPMHSHAHSRSHSISHGYPHHPHPPSGGSGPSTGGTTQSSSGALAQSPLQERWYNPAGYGSYGYPHTHMVPPNAPPVPGHASSSSLREDGYAYDMGGGASVPPNRLEPPVRAHRTSNAGAVPPPPPPHNLPQESAIGAQGSTDPYQASQPHYHHHHHHHHHHMAPSQQQQHHHHHHQHQHQHHAQSSQPPPPPPPPSATAMPHAAQHTGHALHASGGMAMMEHAHHHHPHHHAAAAAQPPPPPPLQQTQHRHHHHHHHHPSSQPVSQPPQRRPSMVGEMVRGPVDVMDGISDDESGRAENKRDRRRRMIHENLTRIYTTFMENKEQIYHEKSMQYKTELRKLLDGTHDEFQEKLSELARQRDESIECAELLRDYQLQTAEQLYAIESEQAENEYQAGVGLSRWHALPRCLSCRALQQKDLDELRDRLLQDLEERRRKLREEKDAMDVNVDLPYDAYGMSSTRAHNTRALRKKGQTRGATTEQKTKRGPRPQLTPLNFGATASDVEDDLLAIQRGIGSKKAKARRA
ncbi:hypothetical protein SYNPS1DRAFT_27274 [Syncephalis pseudoplumigaleata]|uniref:Sds3-like-domain-containing protein n=1 Tax=Syncephalis pseudoplumigaleata TaxID=1712513 RepID=A0A4P9Z4R4_9FUNG|nr:hypothetical protein SYNPS1DRAFT_27274 [Syncephalis pseudoplumigaleata]|eukprot:RKP27062.1 hypothetical protein SYNPS1DRAFT_27274 [Syncephalis pseudoplumigaleata]